MPVFFFKEKILIYIFVGWRTAQKISFLDVVPLNRFNNESIQEED